MKTRTFLIAVAVLTFAIVALAPRNGKRDNTIVGPTTNSNSRNTTSEYDRSARAGVQRLNPRSRMEPAARSAVLDALVADASEIPYDRANLPERGFTNGTPVQVVLEKLGKPLDRYRAHPEASGEIWSWNPWDGTVADMAANGDRLITMAISDEGQVFIRDDKTFVVDPLASAWYERMSPEELAAYNERNRVRGRRLRCLQEVRHGRDAPEAGGRTRRDHSARVSERAIEACSTSKA